VGLPVGPRGIPQHERTRRQRQVIGNGSADDEQLGETIGGITYDPQRRASIRWLSTIKGWAFFVGCEHHAMTCRQSVEVGGEACAALSGQLAEIQLTFAPFIDTVDTGTPP
jgi:hypothetical protein